MKSQIFIEDLGVEVGNRRSDFQSQYPQRDNEMDLKHFHAEESNEGTPHFNLLKRLLAKKWKSRSGVDSVIFTATKLESYGIAGDFELQSICQHFSLPIPIKPVFGYGCAGFLGMLKHHLGNLDRCLWLSCDSRGISDTRLLGNSALMSDAAGYCLLSRDKGSFCIVDVEIEQVGQFHLIDKDEAQWNKTYFLSINLLFRKIMKNNNLNVADLKYIVPHFTNLKAWNLFQRFMKFTPTQLFSDPIRDIGHLYGMDLVYALDTLKSTQKLCGGDKILFLSVGVGATYGAALLEVCE